MVAQLDQSETQLNGARAPGRRLRVFSGIQPSGISHIGNYLGAIRNWVRQQEQYENIFCVVDLHALSLPTNRDDLRSQIRGMANVLLACGMIQSSRSSSFSPMYASIPSCAGCCLRLRNTVSSSG